MPAFRYVAALLIAVLFTASALIFALRTQRSFVEHVRQDMREAKKAGTLPEELQGVDLDTWIPEGFGVSVSAEMMVRLSISDLILTWWSIWIPAAFAICFAAAFAIGKFSS